MSAPLRTDVQVETLQVIRVYFLRGNGIAPDPIREVTAYFDMDGKFLCEIDPSAHIEGDATP